MKRLIQFLTRPLSDETSDGAFSRWACTGAAIGVFIMATVFFSRHARNPLELVCGLGLTLLTFAALLLTGVCTSRLHHQTMLIHKLPARLRIAEFAGYVGTIGILFAGVWYLPTLPLERIGMTMGLLLVLTTSMAATCLGCWSTLRAVAHRQLPRLEA